MSSQLEYNKLLLHDPLLPANHFAGCKCQLCTKLPNRKRLHEKVAWQVILQDKSYKVVHTATSNTEDFRTSEKEQKRTPEKVINTAHTVRYRRESA